MNDTKFTVSFYELKSKLEDFFKVYKLKHLVQIPLSAFLTLSIVFATSDFKSFLFLSREQVQVVFYMIYLGISTWLVVSFYKMSKIKVRSIDELCSKIMEESNNANFEASCLFLIAKYDSNNNTSRILCFRHKKSGSFYLPCVSYEKRKTIPQQFDDIKKLISQDLCIPSKAVKIKYLPEYNMKFHRFSERKKDIVTYDNKIFYAVIDRFDGYEKHTTNFEVHGRTFFWLSFEEFKDDIKTSHNNSDVIRLLEQNNLYIKIPYSFLNQSSDTEVVTRV